MPGTNRPDELDLAARMLRDGRLRPDEFAAACSDWLSRPDSSLLELIQALISPPGVEPTTAPDSPPRPDGPDGRGTDSTASLTPQALQSTQLVDPSGPGDHHPASPPRSLGPADRYRIRELAGKGGLGLVWKAFDAQLGRVVALKEPRPDRPLGSGGKARFLEEAQVTGQLQHPGIVPLFDLTEDPALGGPFYTMRLVEGRTLKKAAEDYLDRLQKGQAGPTALVDLLGSFVAACQAVSYAHARGVLHRDLKGANIILGDFGEVHVLDWGLAKRSGDPDGDPGLDPVRIDPSPDRGSTLVDQAIGTPAYMAPEQTGRLPAGTPIDRRTDVYGLGAVLYELLTGQPPFRDPSRAELLRQVCEDPPLPPRQHVPAVPPALQAICLKALAKDPAGRYASAAELADEVRRWLADEPVLAHPEPPLARLARWARRHRSAVVASAGILLTATALLAVGTVAIAGKNVALAAARDDAREAALVALQQRDRARENLDQTRKLALEVLGVAESGLAELPGAEQVRREMVGLVFEAFEAIHRQQPDDPRNRYYLADAHAERAKIGQLLDDLGRSVADGDAAIRLLEGLSAEFPDDPDYRDRLAELLRNQSQTLQSSGRLADARDALDRATEVSRQLPEGGPDDGGRTLGSILLDRADLEIQLGRFDGALGSIDESLALLRPLNRRPEPHPVDPMLLGLALNSRGRALSGLGRPEEAEAAFDEGIALARDWLGRTEGNIQHRIILSRNLDGLAALLAPRPGRLDEAEAAADEAIEHWRTIAGSADGYARYRAALADALTFRGGLLLDDDRPEPAEEDLDAALDLLSRLLRESPEIPSYRGQAGRLFAGLARLSQRREAPAEALRRLEVAVAFLRLAVEASPEDDLERRGLAAALDALDAARRPLP
jgi:serine/threonine-protein kinase